MLERFVTPSSPSLQEECLHRGDKHNGAQPNNDGEDTEEIHQEQKKPRGGKDVKKKRTD